MKTLHPQWFLADRLKREDYYYTQYSNDVTQVPLGGTRYCGCITAVKRKFINNFVSNKFYLTHT